MSVTQQQLKTYHTAGKLSLVWRILLQHVWCNLLKEIFKRFAFQSLFHLQLFADVTKVEVLVTIWLPLVQILLVIVLKSVRSNSLISICVK